MNHPASPDYKPGMDSYENLSKDELLRVVRHMRALLTHDELTGLFKGTRLDCMVREEVVRSERYGYHCALLFLDMDNFKMLNDSHGHPIGSQLLAELGFVLKKNARLIDWPFRYGGDEFAFLFPQTSKCQGLISLDTDSESFFMRLTHTVWRIPQAAC